MKRVEVSGENDKHMVLMYAISTCGWCKRAKRFLEDNKIRYEYVDIDLCNSQDRKRIRGDIVKRGGDLIYPTIIVDNTILITGYKEDKIREVLEI
jgi:glutaredoxin